MFCYSKGSSRQTYEVAKLRCEAGNATFPHVNSVEDLDFYTQEIDDRATWVQERSKILKVSTEKTPDKEP